MHDEKQLAFIAAHELGHYYRSHQLGLDDFDYWYEQTSPPSIGKPIPVKDSDQLKTRAATLATDLQAFHFPNEKVSPRLRAIVSSFGFLIGQAVTDKKAATTLNASCSSPTVYNLISLFSKLQLNIPLNREEQKIYADGEANLMKCAPSVSVPGPEIPAEVFDIDVSLFAGGVVALPPGGAKLDVLMTEMSKWATQSDAAATAFADETNKRHLGVYTTEEEADDYGMELTSTIGQSPRNSVEAWLHFTDELATLGDGPFTRDGVDHAACKALFAAGWKEKDAQGKLRPVFAPLGNLADPHHGFCYRLFNLSREVIAHGYEAQGVFPTFSPPWPDIQKAAAAVVVAPNGAAPNGAAPKPVNALVSRGPHPSADRY